MRYCVGMLRRTALVIAVVSASCIKLASFHGSDAGSGDAGSASMADAALPGECGNGMPNQASATMSGTAVCAAGPGYALRFPASGFEYPDELRIGTAEVFGASSACNEESGMGMVAYPLPRFAASSASRPDSVTTTIEFAGPVIAKVGVNWSWKAASTCSAAQTFQGRSAFTMFPDGKLVRYDELTTPATASRTMCDCSSGAQNFILDAYIAFDHTVTLTGSTGSSVVTSTGHGLAAPQQLCASEGGWRIAIAEGLVGRARESAGGSIAVTTDFDASGVDMLSGGTTSTTTAYQIGSGSCATLLAPIAQFADGSQPQLNVSSTNGFGTTIGTALDGLYGGEQTTMSGLSVNGSGTLTLTLGSGSPPIPPGWALWVKTVTLKQPSAVPARSTGWYQLQNGSNEAVIWFRDGLGSGDTITVPTS